MPETTIKDLQTDYAGIRRKVDAQEQALSPDAIAAASVLDLRAYAVFLFCHMQSGQSVLAGQVVRYLLT